MERSFSKLAIIYNEKSCKLAEDLLEAILIINLNKEIAYGIFQNELEHIEKLYTECPISSFGIEILNNFKKKLNNLENDVCLCNIGLYNSCGLLFENNIDQMATFIFD